MSCRHADSTILSIGSRRFLELVGGKTLTIRTRAGRRACPQRGRHLAEWVKTGGNGPMNVEKLAERIRAEFDEMPGMVLTMRQASRFCGVDHEMMRSVIDELVASAYLRLTRGGEIARVA